MNIESLATQQHLIPTLAELLQREWCDYAPWVSPDVIVARFRRACGPDVFPHCLVATSESGQFVGTASIKLYEIPAHIDKQYWLGEVFVPQPMRGQGIATRLIEEAVKYAFTGGAKELYLYTPDQQQFYRRLGWNECASEIMNKEVVSIMVRRVETVKDRK